MWHYFLFWANYFPRSKMRINLTYNYLNVKGSKLSNHIRPQPTISPPITIISFAATPSAPPPLCSPATSVCIIFLSYLSYSFKCFASRAVPGILWDQRQSVSSLEERFGSRSAPPNLNLVVSVLTENYTREGLIPHPILTVCKILPVIRP